MAYSTQKQEQEAPTNQDQLCKLYSFKEEKARYRKSYIDWDKIKRANNKAIRQKAKYLSKDAQAILAPVIQGLKKGKRVFFNHKYISSITLCKRRQNQNIIKQLESVLDITYHNSITYKGKNHRFSYEFSYKLIKLENTSYSEHPIEQFPAQQNDFLYIYKENKNIEDIDPESNFLQNSKEVIAEENTTPIIITFPKEPVKPKKRLLNKRKKPTNKEKKAKVYKPFAYTKPKNLADMLPLIDHATCDELRSKSGRPFSNNFIIQLVLKMSKNSKIKASFDYKNGFIDYMARALRYEKHDAVKTGNINFRFKANISENSNEHQEQQKQLELLKLPEGIWGDICRKLIERCGIHVYNNWFSRLIPIIDEQNKTIELKAPNSFIKQWIETSYRDSILKVLKSLGSELKEIIIL